MGNDETGEKSPDAPILQTLNEDSISKDKNLMEKSIIDETMPEEDENEIAPEIKMKYPTNHLKHFNDLRKATRLFGNEYKIILKGLWYSILSCKNSEVILCLNQIETDGRINLLIVIKSGKGKGHIKRVIKIALTELGKLVEEPTSLHPEQLVGKTIRRQKKGNVDYEQIEGYLSRDYLVIDEGRKLLTSEDLVYSESRRYLRLGQDAYPYNEISKRPVDIPFGEELKYTPYFGTCIFTQPYSFDEDFATDGDLRRYLVPYVNMSGIDRSKAYKNRAIKIIDSKKAMDKYVEFLKGINEFKTFEFSENAINIFTKLSMLLIQRGFSYSTKVRYFTDLNDFTIQELLLKMCSIQALQFGSNIIDRKYVRYAFVDLLELLEHQYMFVTFKIDGYMNYGEGWRGSIGNDRKALKWLYTNGAKSKKTSNISIKAYEEKIMELFSVKERRARSIKRKHEDKGWIKSKKSPKVSKVWINFKPKDTMESIPAIEASLLQEKYNEILEEIKKN